MLTELRIRNFKAFGDTEQVAPLSRITLIYGPNSGGKSSILQALMLLKQSHEGYSNQGMLELIPRGTYVDLGSFPSLIHKHDENRRLEVQVKYDVSDSELQGRPVLGAPRYPRAGRGGRIRRRLYNGSSGSVQFLFASVASSGSGTKDSSELSQVGYGLEHNSNPALSFNVTLKLNETWRNQPGDPLHDSLRFEWNDSQSIQSYSHFIANLFNDLVTRRPSARQEALRWTSSEWSRFFKGALVEPNPLSYGLPGQFRPVDEEDQETSESFRQLPFHYLRIATTIPIIADYRNHIDSITYLGPLRSSPERLYTVSGGVRATTGVRGEYTPHMLYHDSFDLVAQVNERFERFSIPYRLNVNQRIEDVALAGEYVSIALMDENSNTQVTLADVGFGINQLLPVIVEAIASPEYSIISVEQPEIHLHPKLQLEIADLMIDTIKPWPADNKQWIVETHSEMLVRRIQRYIAQGAIEPDDVSILYVNPTINEGEGSTIQVLRLSPDGSWLDEWPQGFFEEGYNELTADLFQS